MQILDKYENVFPRTECSKCNVNLTKEPIQHYAHSNGWSVIGFKKKQWLFVQCPKCGYQSALWKLGIPQTVAINKRLKFGEQIA